MLTAIDYKFGVVLDIHHTRPTLLFGSVSLPNGADNDKT